MAEAEPQQQPGVRRRDVLGVAGGALVGAGLAGAGVALTGGSGDSDGSEGSAQPEPDESASPSESSESPTDSTTPNPLVDDPGAPVRRFASVMAFTAQVKTWRRIGAETEPGLIFATPRLNGMFTPTIMREDGEPVWIDPDGLSATDLRVQTYAGEPVLTYWAGFQVAGHGRGVGIIKDASYRTVATVRTGNGLSADMHEFRLTDRGTALVMAYPIVPADLRSIGGTADGYVFGCRIQEVDVETGEVLLDWDMLTDLDIEETYQEFSDDVDGRSPERVFDPIHTNSIEERGDTLLISARHTHALYLLDRTTGRLRWRLGGKRSDFAVEEDARFSWQHDARWRGPDVISLFDNHGKTDWEDRTSAGLVLKVDEEARRVSLVRRYAYEQHFGGAMGNLQELPGGHVLVGWGASNNATEFTRDGTPLWQMSHLGQDCYRVYRLPWSAPQPETPPSAVARELDEKTMRVFMNWNGATDVARWRVLTGPRADALTEATTVANAGFETTADVPTARFVAVEPLTAAGAPVRSAVVQAVPARAT